VDWESGEYLSTLTRDADADRRVVDRVVVGQQRARVAVESVSVETSTELAVAVCRLHSLIRKFVAALALSAEPNAAGGQELECALGEAGRSASDSITAVTVATRRSRRRRECCWE
jgi:hypothetical protein